MYGYIYIAFPSCFTSRNFLAFIVSLMHAGMKFWKTGKIVKAIPEADYQRLQRSRGRNDPGPTPGPSNAGVSKPAMYVVSDSDSDGLIIPLLRKKKRFFMSLAHQGLTLTLVLVQMIVFIPTPQWRRCSKMWLVWLRM